MGLDVDIGAKTDMNLGISKGKGVDRRYKYGVWIEAWVRTTKCKQQYIQMYRQINTSIWYMMYVYVVYVYAYMACIYTYIYGCTWCTSLSLSMYLSSSISISMYLSIPSHLYLYLHVSIYLSVYLSI